MKHDLVKIKEGLLRKMKASKEKTERASVCISAYKSIESVEENLKIELLAWFLREADSIWFPVRPEQAKPDLRMETAGNHDDEVSEDRILELIDSIKSSEYSSDGVLEKDSSEVEVLVTEEELSVCRAKLDQLIKGIISLYSNEGYTEDDYYKHLWEMLEKVLSPFSEKEKGTCLYSVVCDKRTPYYAVMRGLRMSNDDYQKIINAILPSMEKMWFVLGLRTAQKTETASQLLSIMDELESNEYKTVFLSQLLESVKSNN